MILDIDHIALSSLNFDRDISLLEQCGYTKTFVERGLKNLQVKQSFLSEPTQTHDLSLLNRKGNLGIELMNYAHKETKESFFVPLLEFSTFCLPIKNVHRLGELEQKQPFLCNKVFLEVRDINQTVDFWVSLGAKFLRKSLNFVVFSLSSLFDKKTYYFYVKENPSINYPVYLDDLGFHSLAFITSSVEKERECVGKKVDEVTPIESIEVNGRLLKIFFARGLNGEIFEFISFDRNKFF